MVEVRALQRPPHGVRLVIEAVCIMKEVKPKRVAGEKMGTKVDDYWDPGKSLLQDPTKFLESLFKYDKVRDCLNTINISNPCTFTCILISYSAIVQKIIAASLLHVYTVHVLIFHNGVLHLYFYFYLIG